jgi:hypothetical protein
MQWIKACPEAPQISAKAAQEALSRLQVQEQSFLPF